MNILSEYFFYITGIGIYIESNDGNLDQFGFEDHLNDLFPQWFDECIGLIPTIESTKVVQLSLGLHSIVFNHSGYRGFIYPFHVGDLSIEAVERLRSINTMTTKDSYYRIKRIQSLTSTRLNHIIKLLHETLSSNTIYIKTKNYFEPSEKENVSPVKIQMEHPPLHDFDNENKLMDFISEGNTSEALEMLLYHLNHQRFTVLGDSALRSLKNNAIVYMTIAVRAGIKGGLSVISALSHADQYIMQVEKATTMEDLVTIDYRFTEELCHLVVQERQDDVIISKINEYIKNHMDKKIMRKDLANFVNLSESYLSKYFKDKTGSSLTDHIHIIKLNHASKLLKSSDMDILSIAIACGYDTQNYFSSCFKKYLGQSPGIYRRSSIGP